jgi:YfiH family protein
MAKILEQASSFLQIKNISHGFFTRQGGVSSFPYDSLNQSLKVGDKDNLVLENRNIALMNIGLLNKPLVIPDLVHKDNSLIFDEDLGPADGIITDKPVALGITYADCLPILFSSEDGQVIGAIHAGWRGIISEIIPKTIQKAHKRFGKVFIAAIGPHISVEGFIVNGPVLELFSKYWPQFIVKESHVNLLGIAKVQLENSGIINIEKVGGFTDQDSKNYFSHRRDFNTGRHLAVIGKKS